MKAETSVPFVTTNIIPDRNAGIGSLLWDLQNPQDSDQDGPPLLDREFAFIDVGVSRAKVATALKTLVASDLKMAVRYVATEHPGAVPYATVTSQNDQTVRRSLNAMISKETPREVHDWHYVVDRYGKVSSVDYSYHFYGNEIWESYFMGRSFIYAGKQIDFSNPDLNQALAHDVVEIEARIALEKMRDGYPSLSAPDWNGYRLEKNPLEAALAECGITLQQIDVPQRIPDNQNVMFVGNVLNNYPPNEQARELGKIATNMEEKDIVIVQVDEVEAAFIDVLQVKGKGEKKTRERVRWINTKTLEVHQPVPGSGLWRNFCFKPKVDGIVSRFIESLGMERSALQLSQKDYKILVHQSIAPIFANFFRASPVKETLRIAGREALRRLGEFSVLPAQVEFSEFKSAPRFSGEPNGATKLRRSIFTESMYKSQEKKPSKIKEISK